MKVILFILTFFAYAQPNSQPDALRVFPSTFDRESLIYIVSSGNMEEVSLNKSSKELLLNKCFRQIIEIEDQYSHIRRELCKLIGEVSAGHVEIFNRFDNAASVLYYAFNINLREDLLKECISLIILEIFRKDKRCTGSSLKKELARFNETLNPILQEYAPSSSTVDFDLRLKTIAANEFGLSHNNTNEEFCEVMHDITFCSPGFKISFMEGFEKKDHSAVQGYNEPINQEGEELKEQGNQANTVQSNHMDPRMAILFYNALKLYEKNQPTCEMLRPKSCYGLMLYYIAMIGMPINAIKSGITILHMLITSWLIWEKVRQEGALAYLSDALLFNVLPGQSNVYGILPFIHLSLGSLENATNTTGSSAALARNGAVNNMSTPAPIGPRPAFSLF